MRIMLRFVTIFMVCAACFRPEAVCADNLCINGDFNTVTNENKPYGWIYDLAWTKRGPWKNNTQYVSIKEKDGVRKNVLALAMGNALLHDESVVISNLMPFEQGKTYKISFDGRTDGAAERIYIRGYKWKSGIKPHDNPELSELQDIYHGKPFEPLTKSWKRMTLNFPYFSKTKSSELNQASLKNIRFFALYITIPIIDNKPKGSVYLDNVEITAK
ncbi:MAG: hypothetical protein JXN60_06765 [Lentisphaerae bacterium]|nr:hypothetical protein [Lentisphaerota bacterium]